MTSTWCIIWMIFLVAVAVSFYWYGYTTGKVDGYRKGRKDVNAHLDAYLKNGEWRV